MARRRVFHSATTRCEEPDWRPLEAAVGEEVAPEFMWMFEVVLEGGKLLQAFKHIETRCYLHLSSDGGAFAYQGADRYLAVPRAKAIAAALCPRRCTRECVW
jgi:hypothetical protein